MILNHHYQAYADAFRYGHVSHEWMIAIFQADPLFKIWYQHKYHKEGLVCLYPEFKVYYDKS